ncbi:hypothetical protein L6654_36915 [Bradyrhizobium sp. WYCCWR 13023]|nr:hypothetical protein [Bradyrhizobium zhengyangense]
MTERKMPGREPGISQINLLHSLRAAPPARTGLISMPCRLYPQERPSAEAGTSGLTAALPPIAKIAELLGGDVQGGQVLCPGPGHSAADRSLSVKLDSTDHEGFVTHSFAGDDFKDCRPKIPYRLPQLIAAPTSASVYVCEGEKDADNLTKIGFVATTASEGAAAKWDAALTPYFVNRDVVILPDADRPGRAHAQKVAKAIHSVAASVRVVDLHPERHDGSDVSDFIAHDTAGVSLAREVKEAPLWVPSGAITSSAVAADGAELLEKPRLLVENHSPDRTVAALRDMLVGAGGLYDRGVPVRLAFDQIQRGTVAQIMTPDVLVLMAHTICRPYALKVRRDGTVDEVDVRLPRPLAVMYLDWRGEWQLPPLNGITSAPQLQDDGTINNTQGYDHATGMWCENIPDLKL